MTFVRVLAMDGTLAPPEQVGPGCVQAYLLFLKEELVSSEKELVE